MLQEAPCKGYYEVVQRQPALLRLQELTQDQWGLVTRQQVREAGIGSTTLERLTAPGGGLDRVATGVYRLVVAPIPDHIDLRAAWLQLAPGVPAWERTADQGVVSHRSAAAVYGLGHFPADRHEFTVPKRKQTRRPDVRIHLRLIDDRERASLRGLPVTRPARIASDLLWEHEDPEGVAQLVADATRLAYDDPGAFAARLAPHAARFGLPKGAGLELLGWFLDLASAPEKERWTDEARAHVDRVAGMQT
jgi:predicted transcriptional regulator of viral defense system